METCSHLQTDDNTPARSQGCEDCLKLGDDWVHLRRCLQCGHVGCCDSSKNKHATRHFHGTRHPVVQTFEPGEKWTWCYIDELFGEADTEQAYAQR
jgi:Zn-finger in ubiquitin-hydrolases and other protein